MIDLVNFKIRRSPSENYYSKAFSLFVSVEKFSLNKDYSYVVNALVRDCPVPIPLSKFFSTLDAAFEYMKSVQNKYPRFWR